MRSSITSPIAADSSAADSGHFWRTNCSSSSRARWVCLFPESSEAQRGGRGSPGATRRNLMTSTPLVIAGATLIDGVADEPLEHASIWIENGRIEAIGRSDERAVPAGAACIDA